MRITADGHRVAQEQLVRLTILDLLVLRLHFLLVALDLLMIECGNDYHSMHCLL